MGIPVKKNDIIEIKIEDVTISGDGVGRFDDIAVFVPMCAVGDHILAKIIKVKNNYLIGKIEKIIEASPDRIDCDCSVYYKCGGCAFRHISYNAELQIKQKHVKDCLERIGGFKEINVEKIFGASNTYSYRNKVQIPLGLNKEREIISGFYGLHSHNIMPCSRCLLHPEIFDDIIYHVKNWMKKYNILPYNESANSGVIRHIYFRCSSECKDIMLCIVSAKKVLPFKSELLNLLREKFKNIKSIILNYNPENTNVVLGKTFETLWGEDTIVDTLCGMKFEISPESFYQINHNQTQLLYKLAKEMLNLTGNENILDLYCGIGTIGLTMSDSAKTVVGAEIIEKAVKNARRNSKLNDVKNSKFICADSAKAVKEFKKNKLDIVIVDPPRKGCSESVLEDLIEISPEKILYISCNAATLAKDLKKLCLKKYQITRVCPVDLFPRTKHVETAVLLLSRKII